MPRSASKCFEARGASHYLTRTGSKEQGAPLVAGVWQCARGKVQTHLHLPYCILVLILNKTVDKSAERGTMRVDGQGNAKRERR